MVEVRSIGLALADAVKAVFKNSVILPPRRTQKGSPQSLEGLARIDGRKSYFLRTAITIPILMIASWFLLYFMEGVFSFPDSLEGEGENAPFFVLIFLIFPLALVVGFICSIVAFARNESRVVSFICFLLYAWPALGSFLLLSKMVFHF
jgi:hypothetical protein